jgi:hypothetical protein
MTNIDPCGICGSEDVRIQQVPAPPRLGDSQRRMVETRRCLNPACPSNTGTRRLGESV